MAIAVNQRIQRLGSLPVSSETVLTGFIFVTVLMIRLIALDYNTVFVDEAIYLVNGREALQGTSGAVGLRYMFGSYLYPVFAALSAQVFNSGLFGARVASALVTTGATVCIYFLTRCVLNVIAAQFAAIIFGLLSSSVFVGQLATYDSLGISLLALSAMLLACGLAAKDQVQQQQVLFYAATAFVLSLLSKYLAVLAAVGLGVLMFGAWLTGHRAVVGRLIRHFILPAAALFIPFVIIFLDDLIMLVSGAATYTSQPAPRSDIADQVIQTLWLPAALAVLGTIGLLREASLARRSLVPICWSAALIYPTYHLLASNIRSLDKHLVYALIFLAPLAGWGVYMLIDQGRRWLSPKYRHRLVVAGVSVCLIGGFASARYQQQWTRHIWPNTQQLLNFLQTLPVTSETPILAEGGPIYDFYLDWGDRADMLDTWATHFRYNGERSEAAMEAAVRDRHFQYVVLDGYYTVELSDRLRRAAQQANYTLVFREQTQLSDGSRVTAEVYSLQPTQVKHDDR